MKYCTYLAAAVVILLPVLTQADPAGLPRNLAEDVAVETALSQGVVTRDDEAAYYEGIYNGMRGSCDLVAVRMTYRPGTSGEGRSERFDYQVCNGRISETAERARTDFGIPEGIDDFARSIANRTQKSGSATGDYQGFKFLGRTVLNQNKCSVEVNILWEGRLYSRNISECAPIRESLEADSLVFSF